MTNQQQGIENFADSLEHKLQQEIEDFIYEGYCIDYGVSRDAYTQKQIKTMVINYLAKQEAN